MSTPIRIAHHVSLSGFGGVEQQFAAFAPRAATRAGVTQTAVACSKEIHPQHAPALAALADLAFEKKCCGVDIPQHPAALRRAWQRRITERQNADVALLWNRLGQQSRALDILGTRPALYWEHGSAWLYGEDAAKRDALARLPAAIANSEAARRMLELRWGYQAPVRVIPNGVRAPLAEAPRRRDNSRLLRLGVAGRLIPIKGIGLVLHALAELGRQGVEAHLAIAGDGPLKETLQAQATALGVADRVDFLGVVADMPAFFAGIDVFVHAALREPFGMVAAEAQAAGVPVVCAEVDGLPEVVADGRTGRCVTPTSDLERHAALGGENTGLPPVVYEPRADRIAAPKVCEPSDLAAAINELVSDATRYEAMSAAAIAHMRDRFNFDEHVDRVLDATREYVATGRLLPT